MHLFKFSKILLMHLIWGQTQIRKHNAADLTGYTMIKRFSEYPNEVDRARVYPFINNSASK